MINAEDNFVVLGTLLIKKTFELNITGLNGGLCTYILQFKVKSLNKTTVFCSSMQ